MKKIKIEIEKDKCLRDKHKENLQNRDNESIYEEVN